MNDYILYVSCSHWGMFETDTFWSEDYGWLTAKRINFGEHPIIIG